MYTGFSAILCKTNFKPTAYCSSELGDSQYTEDYIQYNKLVKSANNSPSEL